ncbi:MAG: nucleotide-binding protein, partial [Nitrospira sp.]|nr:nucleotide-binding protein [Nitrospira sp.]
MSIPLRIFLGSSSEGQKRAEVLQELIYRAGEPDVQVRAWWHKGAFPSGKTYIESLCAIMAETDVGIFVATPDDQVVTRGSQRIAARDNVVFELGWSIGSHSRTRSAIVTIGDSKLPSDLDGVNRLSLRGDFAAPDFIDRNLIAMRSYLDACRQEIERAKSESKTILP